MQHVYRLTNPVQNYDWGSHSAIARLQCRAAPTEKPEAELWMGAHPASPSRLADSGQPLNAAIASQPEAWLGKATSRRFRGLPFLFKVLAAGRPLSLQAHPDRQQARQGFDAEERAGVPLGAPERNYKDPNHKPELICALEPFEALCDFRPAAELRRLLQTLSVPALDSLLEAPGAEPDSVFVERLFTHLLELAPERRKPLVSEVLQRAALLSQSHAEFSASFAWSRKLGEFYPDDVGVVVALMLNHVKLKPGEALYLDAGRPHAYLEGVGLEVMANSDNVLRGGLTSKHVDIAELKRVLRFEGRQPEILSGDTEAGLRVYATPAEEFVLASAKLTPAPLTLSAFCNRPAILLCDRGVLDQGRLLIASNDQHVELGSGEAAFLRAGTNRLQVSGSGWMHLASCATTPELPSDG